MQHLAFLLMVTVMMTACATAIPPTPLSARPSETPAYPTCTVAKKSPTFTFTPPRPASSLVYTQPGAYHETVIPATEIEGIWHRYTTTEGVCTDDPVFIGNFIRTGFTSMCSFSHGQWTTREVPFGAKVNVLTSSLPPGGGSIAATDMGVCVNGFGDWECQNYGGYLHGYSVPADEIFFIPNILHEPVYISKNKVFFREGSYKITEITGSESTTITAGAVSSEFFGEGFLVPEIWVGTEADGIVVIQPDTGKIRRYTAENGLPSNTIRSISTESCPKYCDYREIWVATDSGLAYWDDFHWTIYTTADGLPSNNILGADSAIRGSVWAATAGGAAYFDGKAWKVYTQENGLPAGELTGVLWQWNEVLFSTDNTGLIVLSLGLP